VDELKNQIELLRAEMNVQAEVAKPSTKGGVARTMRTAMGMGDEQTDMA